MRDERGAIMVMALFFAVFLVALLFSVLGTAQAIFQREHLQDAVDGAAMTGAVLDAQAMNFVVLINIVMAALLAILVALKAVEALCVIGIGIAFGLAFFTSGGSLVAVPPLNMVRQAVSNTHDTLKPPIFNALSMLRNVSNEIRDVAPVLAKAAAESRLSSNTESIADEGFVWGKAEKLPIEDDDYTVLCQKAGELAAEVAMMPFEPIPGLGGIAGAMSGAAGEITSALSVWFCDDRENGSYSVERKQEKVHPRPDFVISCEEAAGKYQKELSADCQKVEDSRPDSEGKCRSGTDCSPTGPYETRIKRARTECDPSSKPKRFSYAYQLHRSSVDYKWNGAVWVRQQPAIGTYEYKEGEATPPCGPAGMKTSVAHGYALDVHPDGDAGNVTPVCSNEGRPGTFPLPKKDEIVSVSFAEVTQIFGCKTNTTKKTTLSGKKDKDDNQNTRSPKRVNSKLHLGDEEFLLRVVGLKSDRGAVAANLVRLALWGNPELTGTTNRFNWLAKFAYSQAEYFYDGTDVPAGCMWNMNWKARLRQFTPPKDQADHATLRSRCSDLDEDCDTLFSRFFDGDNLSMH